MKWEDHKREDFGGGRPKPVLTYCSAIRLAELRKATRKFVLRFQAATYVIQM
jgi:hypothetical protein